MSFWENTPESKGNESFERMRSIEAYIDTKEKLNIRKPEGNKVMAHGSAPMETPPTRHKPLGPENESSRMWKKGAMFGWGAGLLDGFVASEALGFWLGIMAPFAGQIFYGISRERAGEKFRWTALKTGVSWLAYFTAIKVSGALGWFGMAAITAGLSSAIVTSLFLVGIAGLGYGASKLLSKVF